MTMPVTPAISPERLNRELVEMRKAADVVSATPATRQEFLRKIGLSVERVAIQPVPLGATGTR